MRSILLTAALLFFNVVAFNAFSQSKNELGVAVQLERSPEVTTYIPPGAIKTTRSVLSPGVSISYERLLSKRSGLAVELKCRNSINEVQAPVSSSANFNHYIDFTVQEKIISIPLMYRFHSRFIHLSAGPSVEYYTGWKQQGLYTMPMGTYTPFVEQELSLAIFAGISKAIPVSTNIRIEPALYYNRVLSFKRSYYGASLGAKYRF